jgi:hypothetical protein
VDFDKEFLCTRICPKSKKWWNVLEAAAKKKAEEDAKVNEEQSRCAIIGINGDSFGIIMISNINNDDAIKGWSKRGCVSSVTTADPILGCGWSRSAPKVPVPLGSDDLVYMNNGPFVVVGVEGDDKLVENGGDGN